jgi:V/A-type H+/Na+-transporting ATPase subunit E
MSQQVQELIDKIKSEGIEASEQKAEEIIANANQEARKIIDDAKAKGEYLLRDAKEEVKKMEASTNMALKQSARDTLLSLRKEVESILQKIVSNEVNEALTPENLSSILGEVIDKSLQDKTTATNIQMALNSQDLQKIEKSFSAKLKDQIKQSVTFQSSDDISKGFTISYDEGKSCFDFTDESLAAYLSSYLNERVADLVKESV